MVYKNNKLYFHKSYENLVNPLRGKVVLVLDLTQALNVFILHSLSVDSINIMLVLVVIIMLGKLVLGQSRTAKLIES